MEEEKRKEEALRKRKEKERELEEEERLAAERNGKANSWVSRLVPEHFAVVFLA